MIYFTTNNVGKNRLVLLDIIRILAVGMIIVNHIFGKFGYTFSGFFGIKNFYWVTLGGLGVSILLLLSGFVIQSSYGNKKMKYLNFIGGRIKRIYPTYWLCILLTIVLFGLSVLKKPLLETILDFSGFLSFTGASWDNYVIPTGWFIGLIMSLYIIYPFIKKANEKYNKECILILLLVIEVLSRYLLGKYVGNRSIDWMPLCRVFEFGLGIYLASSVNLIKKLSNEKIPFSRLISFLAKLSFPAFLIHYSVLYMPELASDSMILYGFRVFVITACFSVSIYFFDSYIQKIKLKRA